MPNSFVLGSMLRVIFFTTVRVVMMHSEAIDDGRPKLPHSPKSPGAKEENPESSYMQGERYTDSLPAKLDADQHFCRYNSRYYPGLLSKSFAGANDQKQYIE